MVVTNMRCGCEDIWWRNYWQIPSKSQDRDDTISRLDDWEWHEAEHNNGDNGARPPHHHLQSSSMDHPYMLQLHQIHLNIVHWKSVKVFRKTPMTVHTHLKTPHRMDRQSFSIHCPANLGAFFQLTFAIGPLIQICTMFFSVDVTSARRRCR